MHIFFSLQKSSILVSFIHKTSFKLASGFFRKLWPVLLLESSSLVLAALVCTLLLFIVLIVIDEFSCLHYTLETLHSITCHALRLFFVGQPLLGNITVL